LCQLEFFSPRYFFFSSPFSHFLLPPYLWEGPAYPGKSPPRVPGVQGRYGLSFLVPFFPPYELVEWATLSPLSFFFTANLVKILFWFLLPQCWSVFPPRDFFLPLFVSRPKEHNPLLFYGMKSIAVKFNEFTKKQRFGPPPLGIVFFFPPIQLFLTNMTVLLLRLPILEPSFGHIHLCSRSPPPFSFRPLRSGVLPPPPFLISGSAPPLTMK